MMPPSPSFQSRFPNLDVWIRTSAEHHASLVVQFLRWGSDECECACGNKTFYLVSTRERVRQCKRCRKMLSVTAGTALHGTRVRLATWIAVTTEAMLRVPTCSEIRDRFGVSRSTAIKILHRIQAWVAYLRAPLERLTNAHVQVVHVRRPRILLPEHAPTELRRLDRRRAERHDDPVVTVTAHANRAAFGPVGGHPRLGSGREPPEPGGRRWMDPRFAAALGAWSGPRRRSLRWLSTWLGGERGRLDLEGLGPHAGNLVLRTALHLPRARLAELDPFRLPQP